MNACTNPDILRIIYFIKIIINSIFVLLPIALIVMGLIDVSKATIDASEKSTENIKIFFKRLLYGVLTYAVIWIVTTLMVYIGNIVGDNNFTDCWENATSDKIDKLDKNQKNSNKKTSSVASNKNSTSSSKKKDNVKNNAKVTKKTTDNVTTSNSHIVFVGDSRTVGMCGAVTISSNEKCIAEVGKGYNWLVNTADSKIKSELGTYSNSYVVINLGVNDFASSSYISYYNGFKGKYPKAKLVVVSVTPINDVLAQSWSNARNSDVEKFNSTVKSSLNSDIAYCDVYSKIKSSFGTTDGIHHTNDTYKTIYNEIKKCLK